MVRWSLTVSDETDQRLRAFLAQQSLKKGNLSRFVEEAVKQRLHFEETVNQIQARNLQYSEVEMMTDIEEAIQKTRKAPRDTTCS